MSAKVETTQISGIVALVDRIRGCQAPDGIVTHGFDQVRDALTDLVTLLDDGGRGIPGLDRELAAATIEDLRSWQRAGLDTPPLFDRTLEAFREPSDGQPMFLMAAMVATNGPQPQGTHLEIVSGTRREPTNSAECETITGGYRKSFACINLDHASMGFRSGNCIVLFPESILSHQEMTHQEFALFFFNKFRPIYLDQTMTEVRRLFGTRDTLFDSREAWLSATMTEPAMYDARCMWGHLHDCFHHRGPRPLDKSLPIKTKWHTGLLEELKCDLESILLLYRERPLYWKEVIEFILWERLFRYPRDLADRNTFDAGTGIVLFHDLWTAGALWRAADGRLTPDLERIVGTTANLVAAIEAMEQLDDAAYVDAAQDFVHRRLGTPSPPDRYDWRSTLHARHVRG